jgi:hypothetical protein
MKNLTPEQLAKIAEPLPPEAIKPHPTKDNLSTIKGIFVTERLNQVFGVGAWVVKTDLLSPITSATRTTKFGKERTEYTAVLKTVFTIPEYDIYYECIASSMNDDPGDAAKGATTDAITKIASWIGIGIDVYKGKHGAAPTNPANANLLDLTDKLGLVPDYDDMMLQTLKADYLALVDRMPQAEQAKLRNTTGFNADRYRKGIAFLQSKLEGGAK